MPSSFLGIFGHWLCCAGATCEWQFSFCRAQSTIALGARASSIITAASIKRVGLTRAESILHGRAALSRNMLCRADVVVKTLEQSCVHIRTNTTAPEFVGSVGACRQNHHVMINYRLIMSAIMHTENAYLKMSYFMKMQK